MNVEGTTQAWLEQDAGEQIPLVGQCSLGRASSNRVVLRDDKVSRHHALVHSQGENEFWLVDLGSVNGTYVNGRRVVQPVQLRDGDRVQIGPFLLAFRHRGGAAPQQDTLSTRTLVQIRTAACWLLVADIEGSTQIVRRYSSDELPQITGRWFSRCKQAIESQAGIINQYLGDGFFAYWRAAETGLASVVAGLRQLTDLQQADEPRFRIVLHYGQVSMGGALAIGESPLFGQDVHFVFRLEKLAGTLGQPRLMSQPAGERLTAQLSLADAGEHTLAGFEGLHRCFTF